MSFTINQDAHAVLLPAFAGLDFDDVMAPFLENGGWSILIGETRAEYVARSMSEDRLRSETPENFAASLEKLERLRPGLIVAVDQELAGIERLKGIAPGLPRLGDALAMDREQLESRCFETAVAARALGVTLFLAPVADVVTGTNPWLENRTMGTNAIAVARLVEAFVAGVQRAGIASATKHFPGFNDLAGDPAVEDVVLETPLDEILGNAAPFRAAIGAGSRAVMVGPAVVRAIDLKEPACTSPAVISLLREEFGFKGLIVSDDLDAPATMRGRSLGETAIASLAAGADLLLVAGSADLASLSSAIVDAVKRGTLPGTRLAEAAHRVRGMGAA
ncbi:glycoside hydrolase family 3 protein (plasmid) [Rhizobium sp. CIAT894]|uniref:glycoside hydrolase family 3 N-terminal domain-containing protein n=1 Tax=Rhizobium sp. CIAT894 TaxID=2020312 RepID=UPI000A1E27ED|nr:glycoside hydrolase family 3 N-terminal domain-containing protein [Rhizobium sp. CIAT894]ARM92243.1 glycoside hydrolase family 3 protein [Rhizobium sp. CIAT894]